MLSAEEFEGIVKEEIRQVFRELLQVGVTHEAKRNYAMKTELKAHARLMTLAVIIARQDISEDRMFLLMQKQMQIIRSMIAAVGGSILEEPEFKGYENTSAH